MISNIDNMGEAKAAAQKEYNKALIQEKALHKRNLGNLKSLIEIGKIALENKAFETSKNCFNYVLENNTDLETELVAKLYLLEINMKTNVTVEIIRVDPLERDEYKVAGIILEYK